MTIPPDPEITRKRRSFVLDALKTCPGMTEAELREAIRQAPLAGGATIDVRGLIYRMERDGDLFRHRPSKYAPLQWFITDRLAAGSAG